MRSVSFRIRTLAACALLMLASGVTAQDWPQWRGPNRDGKAPGFKAPATWPASLNKKWDISVGEGDAGASLVGERLFVFSREGGDEVIRALDGDGPTGLERKVPGDAPAIGRSRSRRSPLPADGG
jgi:outer membrane protein assembly factor BamB